MKEPSIRKADLLEKLNEIYIQLEELENVLHSTYLNQQRELKRLQNEGLEIVEERLGEFEAEIDKLKTDQLINKKQPAYRKLGFGIENI